MSLLRFFIPRLNQRRKLIAKGVRLKKVWTSDLSTKAMPKNLHKQFFCLSAIDINALDRLVQKQRNPVRAFGIDANGAEVTFEWTCTAPNIGQIHFTPPISSPEVFGIRIYGDIKFDIDVYWICENSHVK